MIRVIRDKTTKRVRAFWTATTEPGLIEPSIATQENEEVKDIPSMTESSVMAVARTRAGGPHGKIYIHDDRVEADPPIVPPEIDGTPLGELERIRKEMGKSDLAPITWGDISECATRRTQQFKSSPAPPTTN